MLGTLLSLIPVNTFGNLQTRWKVSVKILFSTAIGCTGPFVAILPSSVKIFEDLSGLILDNNELLYYKVVRFQTCQAHLELMGTISSLNTLW